MTYKSHVVSHSLYGICAEITLIFQHYSDSVLCGFSGASAYRAYLHCQINEMSVLENDVEKQDYALFVSLNEAQNISEEWSSEPIDGKCILPKAMRDDGRCHFINRFDAGMHQSRTGGYHQRKSEKLAKNNARGVVFRQTLSYGIYSQN